MRLLRVGLSTARPLLSIAGGFGVVALSGYAFVLVVARWPEAATRAALTSFYFLAITVLLGVAVGLDQATNRRVALALAQGERLGPILRDWARRVAMIAAVLGGLLLALSWLIVPRSLHGDVAIFGTLLLGLMAAVTVAVVRGVLAGAQQTTAYAANWSIEGLSRLALLAVVALAGRPAAWVLALVYVLPYGLSALAAVGRVRRIVAGAATAAPVPTASADPVRTGLVALVTAALLTNAATNLPQLVLGVREVQDAAAVATMAQIFVVSRLVLMTISPVQAVLTPRFTAAVARGDATGMHRALRSIVLLCLAVGALWLIVLAVLGPWLLHRLFGATEHTLPIFLGVGAGTSLLLIGYVLQPALVALGEFRKVAVAWAWGAGFTAAIAALPWVQPRTAAVVAALVGPLFIVVLMGRHLAGAERAVAIPPAELPETLDPARSGT